MHCTVCHRRCKLNEGQTGFCGTRKNQNGESVPVNYAQVTALALDPIEKKPFYRFHPGTYILSAGSFGCNMACPFCQNYRIAEGRLGGIDTRIVSPEALVETALSLQSRGNIGVAFTYNEPMVGYEYVLDGARLAKEKDLITAVVTNGCVTKTVLETVLPYVDAFNIDLKCFTPEGYRRLGGDLEMVKTFIETAIPKAHVEITTLVVPELSDGEDEMREMADWLASLSEDVPYHITRFFPCKNMTDEQPTDPKVLYRLRDIAKRRLRYVYLGNL